jgi:hypothetical protein
MKIYGVGRQTHRQTDMAKLIVVFRNFANAPKTTLALNFFNSNFLPRRKQPLFSYDNHLVLDRDIIAVCSEIHSKQMNLFCGPNIGCCSTKPGPIQRNHSALKC